MNLQTIKEQGEKEFNEKFTGKNQILFEFGLLSKKDVIDWHNSQIDLAYQAGKEEALKSVLSNVSDETQENAEEELRSAKRILQSLDI